MSELINSCYGKRRRRAFSLMFKAHEKLFFERLDILKTFSQLVTEQEEVLTEQVRTSRNNTRYDSDNQELKWYQTTKS